MTTLKKVNYTISQWFFKENLIYRNFISQDGYYGYAVEITASGFWSFDYKIHAFTTDGWVEAIGNSTSLSEAMSTCDTHLISEEYSIIGPVMKRVI